MKTNNLRDIETHNGYKEFFEYFRGVLLILDEKGKYLYISPNADRYQFRRKEIQGKYLSDIFSKGQSDFLMSCLTEVVSTRQVKDLEYHVPVNEEVKWYKLTFIPLEKKENELHNVLTIIWEITHLKK